MTKAEKLLAAKVLRLASSQFSNHGCNDFPEWTEFFTYDQADQFFRAFCDWNGGEDDEYKYTTRPKPGEDDYRMMDYAVMDFLAEILESEA